MIIFTPYHTLVQNKIFCVFFLSFFDLSFFFHVENIFRDYFFQFLFFTCLCYFCSSLSFIISFVIFLFYFFRWHLAHTVWLPLPVPLPLLRLTHPLPRDILSGVSKVSSSHRHDVITFRRAVWVQLPLTCEVSVSILLPIKDLSEKKVTLPCVLSEKFI